MIDPLVANLLMCLCAENGSEQLFCTHESELGGNHVKWYVKT